MHNINYKSSQNFKNPGGFLYRLYPVEGIGNFHVPKNGDAINRPEVHKKKNL
jgi:hypothetical protein